MIRQIVLTPIIILTGLALFLAQAGAETGPRTVYWDDLLPEGEMAAEAAPPDHEVVPLFDDMGPGSMPGPPEQTGTFNTVTELDGQRVRVPGFALALEYTADKMVTEFLLVPYFGACIHVPPPPPNQIVYVTAEKPVKVSNMWDPVWVTGTMRTQANYNDLGNAAYTLEVEAIEEYTYD